jgi:hypothetical protein
MIDLIKLDDRHTIRQEYTGRYGARWVFRFCGDFISGNATTKGEAEIIALQWETDRVAKMLKEAAGT